MVGAVRNPEIRKNAARRYSSTDVDTFRARHWPRAIDGVQFKHRTVEPGSILPLHLDKTRLIEFGRLAEVDRRTRELDRLKTFDFLDFTQD